MRITIKTKIWIMVLSIVLMFVLFMMYYLPKLQGRHLLNNYEKVVQNHANNIASAVKVALTEDEYNLRDVRRAIEFVKGEPNLLYVSFIQFDTTWAPDSSSFQVEKTNLQAFPANANVNIEIASDDSVVVKRSKFSSGFIDGEIMVAFQTKEIIASKQEIRESSLLYSGIVSFVGIFIGFWFAQNISVPVLKLRSAALKVGKGDLSQRVRFDSRDEIGELGHAFNYMVQDLQKTRADLESRTNDLIREKKKSDELLDNLKKTLFDLKNTQEELIRQEKLASIGQLTKGIVDRILNPLNYVTNFSLISEKLISDINETISQNKERLPEEPYNEVCDLLQMVRVNLEKINEHGKSTSRIIKAMESLLREKSQEYTDCDMNKLIEKTVEQAVKESWAKEVETPLEVTSRFEEMPAKVKVMTSEFASVISQLVSNAAYSMQEKIKLAQNYSPHLWVETAQQNGQFKISIKDNGRGIPKKEMDQLFSPFFTTKPTAKGVGLGLYMSQEIVKQHKGNIDVQTTEGESTEFVITIPSNNKVAS